MKCTDCWMWNSQQSHHTMAPVPFFSVVVWKCLHDAALAIWLTCVCRPTLCMVASNYVPRRLGLCWSRVRGLLPVSAASPSMDHEHGTVCQPILEHQIRPSASSSVISRPTCFSSSLRCCWQVGSAPFVRRCCEWVRRRLQIFRLTYLLTMLWVMELLRISTRQ